MNARWDVARSFGLFVLFSYAFFFWLPCDITIKEGDAKGYYHSAVLFAQKNQLHHVKQLPPVASGYPLLLGSCFKLFGNHSFVIVTLNILLSLLCFFSLYKTTLCLFGSCAATFLLWIMPFNIGFLLYSQCALTEIVLAALYALFLEKAVLFFSTQKIYYSAWAGFFLGISLFIKPAAWFYGIFLFLLGGLWVSFDRQQVKAVALFGVSFFGVALSYLSFNWYQFGVFDFPQVMERNLLTLFLPRVYAVIRMCSLKESENILMVVPYSERWSLFFKYLVYFPFICARIWTLNMIKTFFGFFSYHAALLTYAHSKTGGSFFLITGTLSHKVWLYLFGNTSFFLIKMFSVLELVWRVVQYFLIGTLFAYWTRRKQYAYLLFFVTGIGYFVAITGADGCARLRMMIEPALLVLTAGGFEKIYNRFQRRIRYKALRYGEQV